MNWKDHPVIIAVIASVGTFTVGSTIVSQFVIPTWLQLKDNQIALQKTQIESFESEIHKLQDRLEKEPKALKSEVAQLRRQLQMSESDNLKLRQDFDSLDPDSLFAASNVYPRGLRGVRIGDDINSIPRIYKQDVEIKDFHGLAVTVLLKNNPNLFDDIAYYYSDFKTVGSGNTKILHILFQTRKKDRATFDLIKNTLVAKYGDRIMRVEKDDDGKTQYVWEGVLGYDLTVGEDCDYHIRKNQ